jgi:PucR C-terminal helix-turn-helix domain
MTDRTTCRAPRPDPRDSSSGSVPDDAGSMVDLVPLLVARLPAILAEVGEQLADQHPDYARFLAEEFDEIAVAAEGFVARLVGRAVSGQGAVTGDATGMEQALFEEIGRVHQRQGRDLIPLLAAYRTGATVAWQHMAHAALGTGVSAEEFATLAAAVFAAVDQLSEASMRGYVCEQSVSASAREAARAELAELLLSDRSSTAAVRAAAARADWPLSQQAAIVVEPDDEVARFPLARLGPSCLQLRRREGLVTIVTDPSGPRRRARLQAVLGTTAAVVGPTVPLERLPASMRIVQLGLALQREHVLGGGPLFVDEHLDALIVHRDERLLAALRRQQLAPLADLAPAARARMVATLTSWLRQMGDHQAVARELLVHPQTVRYRLAQLRRLFGPKLDDPAARATLMLALAWGSRDSATCDDPPPDPAPAQRDAR